MIDIEVPVGADAPVQESAPQPLPEAPEPMQVAEPAMPEPTATPQAPQPQSATPEGFDPIAQEIDNLFPSSERIGFMTREAQPAVAYENVKLANTTGLPQDFVAFDPQSAKQNWQEQSTTNALRGHDDVARWALESPESAKVASENWEDITSISGYSILYRATKDELAQAAENVSKGWTSGDLSAQTGMAYYRNSESDLAKKLDAQLSAFESTLTEETQDSAMYNVGQFLGMMKGSGHAFARGAGTALIPAILASASTGVGAIPAAGVGALMSAAGIWNATREVEAGLFKRDAIKRGIKPEDAEPMAELVGQINGLFETTTDMVFGGLLGKWLKPMAKQALIRAGISRLGVAEGLQKTSRAQVLGKFGLGVVGTSATEATTEVIQDVVSTYAENVLDVAQGLRDQNALHTPEGRAQLVGEMQRTWWNVFRASTILAGIGGAIGLPANYREARRVSIAQKDFVHALIEGQKSKLGVKYPEVVKEFEARSLEQQGIENVFVDGNVFAQAMLEENVTMEDLATINPDLAKSVQTAIDEGSDVVIPRQTFVDAFVGSNLGNRLEGDVRLDRDALSANELVDLEERAQELFATTMQSVTDPEVQKADETRRAELQEIYSAIHTEMVNAGRSTEEADNAAVMVRNFFDVQADRLNMSPLDLYSQHAINVHKYNDETADGNPSNAIVRPTEGTQITQEANEPGQYNKRTKTRGGVGQSKMITLGFIARGTGQIYLTKHANALTFFHELGHFFLETTMTLASHPNATAQQKADVDTLMEWFGVSGKSWAQLSEKEKSRCHEQFAYNYEVYLFEGKAPTAKMQGVFKRFTRWAIECYNDIRRKKNHVFHALFGTKLPEISDEVHLVMDRLVASDAAVENAAKARALEPHIAEINRAGMTEEEWGQYLKDHADSIEEAKVLLRISQLRNARHLVSRVEAERRAARYRLAKKRAEVKKKFTEETRKEAFYRAKHFLRTGEILDENGELVGLEENHRIDAKFNTSKNKAIANLTSTKDGLDPTFVAELFGLDMTGEEFVQALTNRLSLNDAVAIKVEDAMETEFAHLSDPEAINQEIAEALANEAFTRAISAEYKALKRTVTPAREIAAYAKVIAERILNKTPWNDVSVGRYTRSEGKARRLAEKAMMKNGLEKAAEYKRQELLNHELAVRARQKRAVAEKLFALRTSAFKPDSKLAKTRDMTYVNIVRSIFVEYGIATDKQAIRTTNALELIEKHDRDTASAIRIQLADLADNLDERKGELLTFADVKMILETASGLWEISRSAKVSLIEGKQVEQDALLQELVAQGSKELSKRPDWLKAEPTMTGSQTTPRIWTERFLGVNASMRRVESWCRAMDGGKRGPFTKYLFEPIGDTATKFRTRKYEVLTLVKEALKDLDITDRLIRAPELDNTKWHEKYLSKAQILHMLLHCGNESNKRKLALGYGWGKPVFDKDNKLVGVDYSPLDNFFARMIAEGVLTKKDYDAIQRVWDIFESIKPEAQKAHKEIYGYYFDEVAYQPIQTPFGTYRGGYAPAIVDPARVDEGERRSAEEALGVVGDSFMMPTAPSGFTKARVENYTKPLLLDLNLIAGHVDKVLRFAYLAPRVREVYRLLGDSKSPLTKLVNQYDPRAIKEMFIPWLSRAQGQYVSKPSDVHKGSKDFDNFMRLVRTRISMSAMAGNILNTIQQYTGLSVAAARVDGKFLIRGTKEYAFNPMGARATVIEKSEWMRQRLENNLFELSGDIESLILPKSSFKNTEEWVMKHAYFMQQHAQNTIDVPVWLGAYAQAIESGKSEHEAIRHADNVIRDTQGSFNPEDMSRVEAGTPFKRLFTMFYSYFNMQYNLIATEGGLAWVSKNKARAAYVYFTTLVMPTFLSSALMQLAGGVDCGDDDEFDALDLMRIGTSEFVKANFALIPVAGSIANAIIGGSRDRFVPSPAITAVETTMRTAGYIGRAIEGKDINAVQATKDTLNALSYGTGIPMGQLGKPLGYSMGVITGQVDPETVSDIVRGLISGRDVNK